MGDGRYYTYCQFFDVLLLIFLITLVIASLIYFHYRKNRDNKLLHINIPLILIAFFCIMRMGEIVIPNLFYAHMLRNVECGILVLVILILSLDKKTINTNRKTIFFILIPFIIILLYNRSFVESYEFHNVFYTPMYKWLLVSCLFTWILSSIKDLIIGKGKYNNKQFVFIKLFVILIPISMYLLMIVTNLAFYEYFEIILLACFTVYLNFVFKFNNESSLTMLAFDKIGDASTNYIFVTDENYKLIYKNEAATKSGFFVEMTDINASDFAAMFKGESIKKTTNLGKEYIMLKIKNGKKYFAYKAKNLKNGQKHIGFIITVTNITDLIELLVNLENKKEESRIVNEKLKNYSDVVYHIEKEKEINNLLDEIVSLRDIQMKYLSRLIFDTKEKLNDNLFEEYIDLAINKTNEILEEVRDTVSKYREYDSIK